jgi:tryptophan halogenase
MPRGYHPAVDWVHDADLRSLMENTEKVVASCAAMMPPHGDFIARHCAAVD